MFIQVRPFEYEGVTYWSCEQAYQALKFIPGPQRNKLAAIRPMPGETDSAHGMRCWSEGQRGTKAAYRSDWDATKVGVMLAVNRAKYAAHADLRADLLATGAATIAGGPSTSWRHKGQDHKWQRWNGLVQMLVREELRETSGGGGGVPGALAALLAEFNGYEPGCAAATGGSGGIGGAVDKARLSGVSEEASVGYQAGETDVNAAAVADPTVGSEVVCIGDLHGCADEAASLWENLTSELGLARLAAAHVVFLGDFVDRGPDTRRTLDWLLALRSARAAAEAAGTGGATHFLCGNHDFGMAAYLGCLPAPGTEAPSPGGGGGGGGVFGGGRSGGGEGGSGAAAARPYTAEELNGTKHPAYVDGFYDAPLPEGMHYQGRRWGGSWIYDADTTFASYGVDIHVSTGLRQKKKKGPTPSAAIVAAAAAGASGGDGKNVEGKDADDDGGNEEDEEDARGAAAARAALVAAVPEAHKRFLADLAWVADLSVPFAPGRVICVHAGLKHDADPEAQVVALKARDFRDPVLLAGSGDGGVDPGRLAGMSERSTVRAMPPSLGEDTCWLVSGHHHAVEMRGRRVIMDNAGGAPGARNPLSAVVLPSLTVVSSSLTYPR